MNNHNLTQECDSYSGELLLFPFYIHKDTAAPKDMQTLDNDCIYQCSL